MLVLSRRRGERIVITTPEGRQIVVEMVESNDHKARLGLQADADVVIHREEVYDRIQRGQP
jgi:carbon storage regulator